MPIALERSTAATDESTPPDNAQQRYYEKLKGVTEPEAKRKIIGEEFIRVFEEEARKIGAVSTVPPRLHAINCEP